MSAHSLTLMTVCFALTGVLAGSAHAQSAAAAARQDSQRCASVVFVDCNGPASRAVRSTSDAESRMRTRRLLVAGNGEDRTEDDGSIIVRGERVRDPKELQWQHFDERMQRAALPDCLGLGSSLGLLAVPVIPLMAVSGRCR